MSKSRPPGSDIRATDRIQMAGAPPTTARAWYLLVAGAGDEPTSRVVALPDPGTLVFGRSPDCDVVIDHHSVSRRHAQFQRRGGHIIVEDIGSTNGTLVNGRVIDGPRRLAPGDVVGVGLATAVLATTTAARDRRHVATVSAFDERLATEVDRARRYHRPLGLIMLRLAGNADVRERFVAELARTLRRMDLLAEYGPDEFALVLPESGPAATDAVLTRARQLPPGLTLTAGVATFPEDGAHEGELIGCARDRLRGFARIPGAPTGQPVVIDPAMRHVMTIVARVAPAAISVLVLGETGVGKEVIAEAIHRQGPRARGPFVRLNCAALTETLVESELFGHEQGAFTGAVAARPGHFELASGGTLFLDEIGELPLETQAKLLRVLEQRRVVRVGGVRELPVDVRIICATHRDLQGEVARARFRQDLYFRIGGFVIPVPPLRDRRGEIAPLAQRFVAELSPRRVTFAPEALAALEAYDWPGNVRELRNTVERALVLADDVIDVDHLPDRVVASDRPAPPTDLHRRVADAERQVVIDALAAAGGKQAGAARALGISRFALMRLLDKHDLKRR